MLMLALPGSAYLYYGEELGLPEVLDLPAEARQDPAFHRTNGEVIGRDGARVPMPWEAEEPAYGFGLAPSAEGRAWLPQPPQYGELAVDRQAGDPKAILELYRTLLRLRRDLRLGEGVPSFVDLGDDIVAVDVLTDDAITRIVVNLGASDWLIPSDAKVLLGSDPGIISHLGTDQAVWLSTSA